MTRPPPLLPTLGCLLACLTAAGQATAQEVTFAELSPILRARCIICHAGPQAPLGLRLDSLEGLLQGSRNGPVVKAGDPAGSELIRRIQGTRQPRMPMTGPPFLSAQEIALFERWVASGLKPGTAVPTAAEPPPAPPGDLATEQAVTYAQVAPIFAQRCARCHTDRGLMGPAPEGYRLTSYRATLSSTDRVRVVPGHPRASELLRRVRGQARPRMPFDGPPFLNDRELSLIARWIEQGARNSEGRPAALPAGARVRLHGTLTGRWRLDDLRLIVTRRTRRDKAPAPGDYVEVRGRLQADGSVVAERIRRR